jgi:regulation of enolase protein 1 (concanavalin A-like superfamily)
MCKKSVYLILLLALGLAIGTASGQSVKINFQSRTQGSREVPVGYLPDYGDLFGDRGNGWSYGWSVDMTGNARDRDINPDQRYDTNNSLRLWSGSGNWEIAVPNGTYDVYIVGGDAGYKDQTNSYLVEGVEVLDPTPYPPGDNFDEFTVTVAVDDGRLTIGAAPGTFYVKICFVHIVNIKVALPVSPANGSILSDTSVQFQWLAGKDAIQHDVYIGEDYDAVDAATPDTPDIYKGRQSEVVYPATGPMTLEPGKTYYWRIDEFDGTNIYKGGVSSFTVQVLTAYNPEPVDGGIFVDPNVVLSWSRGAGALLHFIYFGDNFDSVRDAATNSPEYKGMKSASNTSWDPPDILSFNKTYYWRIDERGADGIVHKGDVWSFTTASHIGGGLKGQYYSNMNLDGDPNVTRIDPQIDFDWGSGSPDPNVTADGFSVRWTGAIEIPASGEWTFWTHTDDSVRLWVNGQLLIEVWGSSRPLTWDSGTITLNAGSYPIEMNYFDIDYEGHIAIARLLWQGPLVPTRQVIPTGALTPPLGASSPYPANNAVGVRQTPILRWTAGDGAVNHDVYFGTDKTAVENADTTTPDIYRGRQELENTEYIPAEAPLPWDQTYYWRIDEIEADGTIRKGSVWSFTVVDYVIVDDFEDYNDINNKIYDVWVDYFVNNTGMTVGHLDPPFAEQSIVHNGSQSMYMHYDNDGTVNEGTDYEQSGTLLYSEAERKWADAQDWTANSVQSLALWFRGASASVGSFTIGPPITITAAGADIWGTADQFHFAYKRLSSLGSITARVVSLTNTDPWAKAGVMIRESLDPGSAHAMVIVSPSNGVSFQRRLITNDDSESTTQAGITAPQWVRLTRSGNTFTAEYSAGGNNWVTVGDPVTINMSVDTYIGLCLTSHNVNETCTAEFSDVSTTGAVTGDWQSQDIGIESNIPEGLYVVVQDGAGNSAVVNHPDPLATTFSDWTQWDIPLTDFAGVNMQNIEKMAIGVGDRTNPQAGGAGTLYIDDIGLHFPASEQ